MKRSRLHQIVFLLFISIVLLFSSASQARAESPSGDSDSTLVSVFQSETELNDYFRRNIEPQLKSRATNPTRFYVAIARNGNTSSCQVHIKWNGIAYYQGVRFRQMKIASTSSLNPQTFDTIGNGSSYRPFFAQYATPNGTVFLESVSIPTGIETVRVTTKDFQAYNMSSASWLSSEYPLNGLNSVN